MEIKFLGNIYDDNTQGIITDEWSIVSYYDYLIFTDKFGRKFKLEPVKNENIKFPFVVTPLREE